MTTPPHPRPDFLSYPPPSPHDGTGPAVLVARDLAKSFGDVHAVDGVSLDVAAGTSLALTGPSGSGKSTLLHLLAGVLTPDTGSIQLDGAHVERLSERARSALRRDRVGFVFQQGFLLAELPAVENVALPLLLTGTARRQAVAEAARWFPRLGIEGLERRRPGELSGGQAQRVALARALVGRPAVLFADEPTAALDSSTSDTVMNLLLGAARDVGVAVVVVTHDAAVAARCDRTLDLRDGRLARSAGQAPGDGRRTQAEVVR